MIHRTTPTGHHPTLMETYGPSTYEITAPRNLIWLEKVSRLIRASGQDCEVIWHVP